MGSHLLCTILDLSMELLWSDLTSWSGVRYRTICVPSRLLSLSVYKAKVLEVEPVISVERLPVLVQLDLVAEVITTLTSAFHIRSHLIIFKVVTLVPIRYDINPHWQKGKETSRRSYWQRGGQSSSWLFWAVWHSLLWVHPVSSLTISPSPMTDALWVGQNILPRCICILVWWFA